MWWIKKTRQEVIKEKTLSEKMSEVKSVFKKSYDDANSVSTACLNHIAETDEKIKELNKEIDNTVAIKNEADSFMEKLKGLI